jgi:hypothetical protein
VKEDENEHGGEKMEMEEGGKQLSQREEREQVTKSETHLKTEEDMWDAGRSRW